MESKTKTYIKNFGKIRKKKRGEGEAESEEESPPRTLIASSNILTSKELSLIKQSKSTLSVSDLSCVSTNSKKPHRSIGGLIQKSSIPMRARIEPKKSQSSSRLRSSMKHYEIKFNYNLETHISKIDESFIDYVCDNKDGNFMLFFDSALYEAPQITLDLEKELERQDQERK